MTTTDDIARRLRAAIHMESAAIAPQTSALIEAAREAAEVLERYSPDNDMLAALKAVEEWWLRDGMNHFNGAPYAIFAVREAIAKAKSQSSGQRDD